MLTSISLVNAGALWAAIFVPLLVLAYIKTQRNKSLIVSSVIILRSLKRQAALRSRIKLPWRFYFELLCLLLLLFAAALPMRPQANQIIALVIDNSLSMQAIDSSSKTRFELAMDHARGVLGDLASDVRVVVYGSAPKLYALNPKPVTSSEAIAQLDNIVVSAGADNLQSDLRVIGESGRFTRIFVLSDKPIEFDGSSETYKKPNSENVVAEIKGVRVGSPSENYYVANLRYGGDSVNTEEASIIGSVAWSGLAARNIVAVLEAVDAQTNNAQILKKEEITLAPNQVAEVSFVISRSQKGRLRLSLESKSEVENSIKLDDRAWLPPLDGKRSSVLLVSDDASSGVMGLDAITSLHFEKITSSKFASMETGSLGIYELLIFHRSAPKHDTSVSSLFILPPDDNTFFPVIKTIDVGQITSWQEQHPLTSYLRVPLLPAGRTLVFSVPAWSQPIINIEQGPMLVAGESLGVRYVGVGTEILPFEGEKTPAQSVLAINIVNWLLGSSGSVGNSFLAGAVYAMDKRHDWRVVSPDSKTQFLRKGELYEQEFFLSMPGIYSFEDDAGSEPYEVAVNCFHPGESETASANSIFSSQFIESQISNKQEKDPIWPLILKIVLALLLLDLGLRIVWRGRNVSK